jgi:predicted transcriptional regulator
MDITEPGWLDHAIKDSGIAISWLAHQSGVSRAQIWRIRNCTTSPRLGTLKALKTALDAATPTPS